MTTPKFDPSRASWIARGFEELVAEYDETTETFDVLIVGSGYGGAIAADTLSQYQKAEGQNSTLLNICVLERGNEYLPGSFPRNSTELPAHVRFGRATEGLFDFRPGPDVSALVANGLGGGSLINAGVMLRPLANVFEQGWPDGLSDIAALDSYYDEAELLLGSRRGPANAPVDNTVTTQIDGVTELSKHRAIRQLAGNQPFIATNITVAAADGANSGNVNLTTCIRCGGCATGCNFNAKDSLDTNLLYRAHTRGVDVYSGATVLNIERDNVNEDLWLVNTVFTNSKLRESQGEPVQLRATHVILAAGTFGSTEILLRSATEQLNFSRLLGQRCSTNGDTLITHYDSDEPANAVAREEAAPDLQHVGPTITGMIDLRESDDNEMRGLVIQEMASPAAMRRVFREIYATVNTLHGLGSFDRTTHRSGFPHDDIYEARDEQVNNASLYAVMGDDGAQGEIELPGANGDRPPNEIGMGEDGLARMRWPGVAHRPVFDQETQAVASLAEGSGGTVIPNPLWQLFPESVALLTSVPRGAVMTVHPLGGCVMANSSTEGAVNEWGQVFVGDDSTETYNELVVLDGSIIPTALSANPALTIAAVALRSAEHLAGVWGYQPNNQQLPIPAMTRPVFRIVNPDENFEPDPTTVRFSERMAGEVTLRGANGSQRWQVELTLRFDDKALGELASPSTGADNGRLHVDVGATNPTVRSRLRIFTPEAYEEAQSVVIAATAMEQRLDELASFSEPIERGSLTLFERQHSWSWIRVLRGGWAWLVNRGIRDMWQARGDDEPRPTRGELFRSGLALASHVGERRLLTYELDIGVPLPAAISTNVAGAWHIEGRKCLTYSVCSNPWNQLMEMRVTQFPGLVKWFRKRVLSLDLKYLARIKVPLLEITGENDGVTALGELGSFLAYVSRLLFGIHAWSFRAPDRPESEHVPDRLPGKLIGIPEPEIHQVFIGHERPYWSEPTDAAVPVYVRLTRYARPESLDPPLVMMHGYSASGTTFAHNAVAGNYASHFYGENNAAGRDVWIVDFRTSCGMPTATDPWSFEQVAYRDIPEAIQHICNETNNNQVDVIAHCMGATMFSMAVLHATEPLPDFANQDARDRLPGRINRVVFSQVSPLVVLSPANVLRGYIVQYFRELLPDNFQLNPGPDASPGNNLLDRLLATVPYPREEFRVENPLWPCARTSWTRTRHRMDILFGRVFNARNMETQVLDHIDDFFGPFSVDTVTQTIHFARYNMITDVHGENRFVSRYTLVNRWGDIPLLMINARNNGLADHLTQSRTTEIFEDSGRSIQPETIENAGHQDCLIGKEPRRQALLAIDDFFDQENEALVQVTPANSDFVAYTPWIGPIVTTENNGTQSFRLGSRPTHREPVGVLLLRVEVVGDNVLRADGLPFGQEQEDLDYLEANVYFVTSLEFRINHWGKFTLPGTQPNGQNHAGNSWLVMVVYNEAAALNETNEGHYRMMPGFAPEYINRLTPGQLGLPAPAAFNLTGASSVVDVSVNHFDSMEEDGEVISIEFFRSTLVPMRDVLARASGSGLQVCADSESDHLTNLAQQPVLTETELAELDGDELTQHENRLEGPGEEERAVLDRLVDDDFELRNGLIPDLPAATADECSFLLTSCQYPAGLLDSPVAYQSYLRTIQRLNREPAEPIHPRFGIFAGDQVYVDASAGLFDPSIRDGRFELPYHYWLRFPYVRDVLRRIPSFMGFDDHEINNNWEPINAAGVPANVELMERGVDGYRKYQRGQDDNPGHFHFVADGFPFYMLDTRSTREARDPNNIETANIANFDSIPATEETARTDGVLDWLDALDPDRPKFIVTPSMLLPRHVAAVRWGSPTSALHSDGWDGYPGSLYRILREIWDRHYEHVVFLSGDEHLPCIATIDLRRTGSDQTARIHSVHTAAAFAPYTFANGARARQIEQEEFDFVHPQNAHTYTCDVNASYPAPGDGMTYLRALRRGGNWELDIDFPTGLEVLTI